MSERPKHPAPIRGLATRVDVTLGPALPTSERARKYVEASRAKSTVAQYARDWAHFQRWCAAKGVRALPASPRDVADYLMDLAEATVPGEEGRKRAVGTINRFKCALAKHHWLAGAVDEEAARAADPTKHRSVEILWSGICRLLGAAPVRKSAVTIPQLVEMVRDLPAGLVGVRDRALLLFGFFSAMRRAELVAVRVEDLRFEPKGLVVTIRVSKTDQRRRGRTIIVPSQRDEVCPVRAVRAWMDAAEITSGPVLRPILGAHVVPAALGARSVALRVKAAAARIGVAPQDLIGYAGHSLRAGFVTAARQGGADIIEIMEVTGHESFDMLRRYVREADRWRSPAASRIVVPAERP